MIISTQFSVEPLVQTFNKMTRYYEEALQTLSRNQYMATEIAAKQVVEQAYKYFDAMARSSPDDYKHMYEFEMAGQPNGRLYELTSEEQNDKVKISYVYIDAKVPAPESDQVFRRKAQALEEGWTFTISPKNSSVLVFEIEGETIFTSDSVTVTPGKNIQGNFSKMFEDYTRYIAPKVLDRVAVEISKLRNVEQGMNNMSNGGQAMIRDIRSADVSATNP